jgi:hypothetical protein
MTTTLATLSLLAVMVALNPFGAEKSLHQLAAFFFAHACNHLKLVVQPRVRRHVV